MIISLKYQRYAQLPDGTGVKNIKLSCFFEEHPIYQRTRSFSSKFHRTWRFYPQILSSIIDRYIHENSQGYRIITMAEFDKKKKNFHILSTDRGRKENTLKGLKRIETRPWMNMTRFILRSCGWTWSKNDACSRRWMGKKKWN